MYNAIEGCSLLHTEWVLISLKIERLNKMHIFMQVYISASSWYFYRYALINKLPLENMALNFIITLASLQGNNAGSYGWTPCGFHWLTQTSGSYSPPFAILLSPCGPRVPIVCGRELDWDSHFPTSSKGRVIFSPHTQFFSKHLRQKMINNSETSSPKHNLVSALKGYFVQGRMNQKDFSLYRSL